MPHKKRLPVNKEALRFENEFLKAKISAEFGADHMDTSEDCPPEIENEFLKGVIRFEEAMKNAKEIRIYDFIGKPEFVKEQDLSDEQLPVELERVTELLGEKNIMCDVICPVDDRVLYKFLTEELFQHNTMNTFIPGMGTHFIYEEFHPNHEYDTDNKCEDILKAFFAKDFHEHIKYCFPNHIRNFVSLTEFRDCFCKFKNVNFEILPSKVNPNECTRIARLSFDGVTSPGTKPIHYEGEAIIQLEYEDEWWQVISVVLPGMVQ